MVKNCLARCLPWLRSGIGEVPDEEGSRTNSKRHNTGGFSSIQGKGGRDRSRDAGDGEAEVSISSEQQRLGHLGYLPALKESQMSEAEDWSQISSTSGKRHFNSSFNIIQGTERSTSGIGGEFAWWPLPMNRNLSKSRIPKTASSSQSLHSSTHRHSTISSENSFFAEPAFIDSSTQHHSIGFPRRPLLAWGFPAFHSRAPLHGHSHSMSPAASTIPRDADHEPLPQPDCSSSDNSAHGMTTTNSGHGFPLSAVSSTEKTRGSVELTPRKHGSHGGDVVPKTLLRATPRSLPPVQAGGNGITAAEAKVVSQSVSMLLPTEPLTPGNAQTRIYSKPVESSPPSPTASSRGNSIPSSARSVSGAASTRRGSQGPVTYHVVTDHDKCQSTQEIEWGRLKLRPEGKSTVVDACSCSIAGTQNGAPLPPMDSACLLQAVLPEGAFGPAPVDVFAVFDGIGLGGGDCSKAAADKLRQALEENIMAAGPSQGMMRGLCDAFASLDDASISAASSGGGSSSMMAMNMSGSVATVVMCLDRHLVVANVGDARAVLCVQGVGGQMSAVDLCEDHRPGLVSERQRIRGNGGDIRVSPARVGGGRGRGAMQYRVVELGSDDSAKGLSVSRVLGCSDSKRLGVVATPDIHLREIGGGDRFLVLCSGSVYEQMNSQEVVSLVAEAGSASNGCRAVSNEARRRCIESSSGSKPANRRVEVENGGGEGGGAETAEDMTCIVVMLSEVMDWGGAGGRDPTVVGGSERVGSQKDNVNSNFQAWFDSQVKTLQAQKEQREMYAHAFIVDDVPSSSASDGASASASASAQTSNRTPLPEPPSIGTASGEITAPAIAGLQRLPEENELFFL